MLSALTRKRDSSSECAVMPSSSNASPPLAGFSASSASTRRVCSVGEKTPRRRNCRISSSSRQYARRRSLLRARRSSGASFQTISLMRPPFDSTAAPAPPTAPSAVVALKLPPVPNHARLDNRSCTYGLPLYGSTPSCLASSRLTSLYLSWRLISRSASLPILEYQCFFGFVAPAPSPPRASVIGPSSDGYGLPLVPSSLATRSDAVCA